MSEAIRGYMRAFGSESRPSCRFSLHFHNSMLRHDSLVIKVCRKIQNRSYVLYILTEWSRIQYAAYNAIDDVPSTISLLVYEGE